VGLTPPGGPPRPGRRRPAAALRSARAIPPSSIALARETFRRRVLALIRRIPPGRVATYGQIAAWAGYPRQARRVGQALAGLRPEEAVPWQRVLNAQGRVSARAPRPDRPIGEREREQERLLRREGVRFAAGRVKLERYGWRPPARVPAPPSAEATSR